MGGRGVVVTGIGVVAPGGLGAEQFWDLLASGRTATRRVSSFDPSSYRSQVAAEVDFFPEREGLSPQEIRRMDRFAQFAVVAAREAVQDSGLDLTGHDPGRVDVSVGSATGATLTLEREYAATSDAGRLWEVDPTYAHPFLHLSWVPSSVAAEVAWVVGAEGPAGVISTGCTSGLDAVTHGAALVAEGSADVVLTGASDAPISPITLACFDAIRATTPNNDAPSTASRPFDRDRSGFVLGEGGAMFVLEEKESALARGATIYCEIAGYATRSNAYHMTGLKSDGLDMAEAIRTAMDEARVNVDGIDYVNAHGSSTKQNDIHETAAFKTVLGEHAYTTPVSSIKSMVGHSLGGIGSIELAACGLAMRENVIPPTANLSVPDPECDLDYVPRTARESTLNTVLSVGSGFGGFQTAVILTRVGERS